MAPELPPPLTPASRGGGGGGTARRSALAPNRDRGGGGAADLGEQDEAFVPSSLGDLVGVIKGCLRPHVLALLHATLGREGLAAFSRGSPFAGRAGFRPNEDLRHLLLAVVRKSREVCAVFTGRGEAREVAEHARRVRELLEIDAHGRAAHAEDLRDMALSAAALLHAMARAGLGAGTRQDLEAAAEVITGHTMRLRSPPPSPATETEDGGGSAARRTPQDRAAEHHRRGTCIPCRHHFAAHGRGCTRGEQCRFCHHATHGRAREHGGPEGRHGAPPASREGQRDRVRVRVDPGHLNHPELFFPRRARPSPDRAASPPEPPRVCSICLDRTADARIEPCGHDEFCRACVDRWSREEQETCPICRQRVVRVAET